MKSTPKKRQDDCAIEITKAIGQHKCTVLKSANHKWAAKNRGSSVLGVPPIDLQAVLQTVEPPVKTSARCIQAGVSIVRIDGPALDVESHYHISHLVGLVTAGSGWLSVPTNGGRLLKRKGHAWVEAKLDPKILARAPNVGKVPNEDRGLPVNEGDVVVLPRGAYHVFRCARGKLMEYIALEFSDEQTDYQAHH